MIKKVCLVVFGILLPQIIYGQYTYTWDREKISLESAVEMEVYNSDYSFVLEGGGIKADIGILEGMGNTSELAGSLDTYASSFGFKVSGKAKSVKMNGNIYAAWLNATQGGQSVILMMFATQDLRKHYICEASFPESRRSIAEAIVNSVSCGGSGQSLTVKGDRGDDGNKDARGGGSDTDINGKDAQAPDFTLKDVNGKSVSLSAFKGKTVLLDFWGTWCAPCVENIPSLKTFYEKNGGDDFELISVANDPNTARWKKMIAEKGMNWTNVIDPDGSVCSQYHIQYYPTMFLISSDGKILDRESNEHMADEYLTGIRGSLKNAGKSSGKNAGGSEKSGKVSNDVRIGDNNSHTGNTSGSGSKKPAGIKTNTHTTGSAMEKTTWRLLSVYSAEGYTILDETVTAPSTYGGASVSGDVNFTQWIDGTSERDVVKSINTVVHEMCHGYAGKLYIKALMEKGLTPDGTYTAYYLGNGEMRLVKHTEGFTTDKIHSVFPKKLMTPRYETYVYPSSPSMGSQQHGVYGLLDELHAYYAGTKAAFDFYNYYKEKDDTAEGWNEYVTNYYATYYAYLEFKSYILYYMLYAKQKQPAVYDEILGNEDYLYALRKTDENWTNLINDFKKTREAIFKDLQSRGIAVNEEGEFTYFGNKGTGNFSNVYNTFLEGLKDKKIQEIAQAMGLASAGGPEF